MTRQRRIRAGEPLPLARRVLNGAGLGAAIGACIMALLLAAVLVVGSESSYRGGAPTRGDLLAVLAVPACATGGALLGAARPFMRVLPVALLAGWLAAVPFAAAQALAYDHGYRHWTSGHTAWALIGGALYGVVLGVGAWRTPERRRRGRWR